MTKLPTHAFPRAFAFSAVVLVLSCRSDPGGPSSEEPLAGHGSLTVQMTTGGHTLDTDGYELLVDGAAVGTIGPDETKTFDSIPAGSREITLSGVALNCRMGAEGGTEAVVPANGNLTLGLGVACDSAWRNVVLVRRIEVDTTGCPTAARAAAGQLSQALLCSSHFSLVRMRPDGSDAVTVVDHAGYGSMNAAGTMLLVSFSGGFGLYHVGTGALDVWGWSGHYEQFGALSPDGRRFAFTTDKSGQWQTYVRNIDGTREVRVSNSGLQETAPSWSPDGTRLVLGRSTADYLETPIVSLSAAGGSEKILVPVGEKGAGAYGFSRDGQRILYNSFSAGTNDIWSMNVDGTDKVNHTLTDRLGFHNSGLYSPDRSQVMYDRGGNGLFVVDTAGGSPVQITFPVGIVFEAPMAWLP